jgi:hypothetical protein
MTSKRKNLPAKNISKAPKIKTDLIEDLRQIIEKTRQSIATTINANLTILYWHVGNRIRREILEEERAEYGKKLLLMSQSNWHLITAMDLMRKT